MRSHPCLRRHCQHTHGSAHNERAPAYEGYVCIDFPVTLALPSILCNGTTECTAESRQLAGTCHDGRPTLPCWAVQPATCKLCLLQALLTCIHAATQFVMHCHNTAPHCTVFDDGILIDSSLTSAGSSFGGGVQQLGPPSGALGLPQQLWSVAAVSARLYRWCICHPPQVGLPVQHQMLALHNH